MSYPTLPTTPCSSDVDMSISRILRDRIHLLLTLSWIIMFVHMMLVIISQMNIQGNSYDFPRCQRHPVPLVWTYQFREFVVARNIYLWPFLNYYVCAHGACNYIPNEYLKELLWYPTIPTAPCSPGVDIPVSRICCDRKHLILTPSWIIMFVHRVLTKIFQMSIQMNTYAISRSQRHPALTMWTYQF